MDTTTDEANVTELSHDDGRGDPALNASEQTETRTAVYDDPARGYGCVYGPDDSATAATSPTASSGERTTKPRPFLCDDPGSLCDDPNSVLAE